MYFQLLFDDSYLLTNIATICIDEMHFSYWRSLVLVILVWLLSCCLFMYTKHLVSSIY